MDRFKVSFWKRAFAAGSSRPRRAQLGFEDLECRRLLTTTVTVNTNADTSVANDEQSAKDSNGRISLRSALEYASNNQGPFVIDVPNDLGTFTLTQGVLIIGNAAYGVDKNITIQGITSTGALADPSTVVVDQTGQQRVFIQSSPPGAFQLTINDMTLEGGRTPANVTNGGSALLCGGTDGSVTTINDCIIQNNISSNGPGALVLNAGGSLIVTNTKFLNNSTTGSEAFGAALAYDNLGTDSNGNSTTGTLTVNNCTFEGNSASAVGGAALEADEDTGAPAMNINNSVFIDNSVVSTSNGGAVELANGLLNVTGCVFYGNTATDGKNGIVVNTSAGGAGTVTANNDWWGDNNFPGAGAAEIISANVVVSSRLQLNLNPVSNAITVGQSTPLEAEVVSVTGTNVGTTPVTGTGLEGMSVAFAAGSLSGTAVTPTTATIANGVATSTLLTGSTPGTANPSITFESATQTASVAVEQAPQVTTQPTSVTVLAGTTVNFTAHATVGSPAPTVQWRVSSNHGATFTNLSNGVVGGATYSGVTTDTLTITNPTLAMNQYEYEAVYTNAAGSATSTAAVLNDLTITFTPTTLAATLVGATVSQTLTASGGVGPYTYTVSSGSLPPGLALSSTGLLSGSPTTNGLYTFTVKATDSSTPTPFSGSQSYSLTVNQPPSITSTSSDLFTEGLSGNFTISTGADYPTATTLSESGTLPSGVTFVDNGNGTATLEGAPAFGSAGTYNLLITAANGIGPNATQSFTLTVQPALFVSSAASDTLKVGSSGSFSVTTTTLLGATPALVESGNLPSGVTFVDNGNGDGTLAGTAAVGTGGVYPITIKASNGTAPSYTQNFTLTIDESPTITSVNHSLFTVGDAGSLTVTTAHDYPSATTLSESGALPAGVSFVDNGNGTATLSGTPSASSGGVYTFIVTAANGVSPDATQSFTLTVDEAPSFTSASSDSLAVGVDGTFNVTTGHDYPTGTTLTESGALPSGVTFTDNGDGDGTLAGAAAAGSGGAYPISFTASNGINPNATQSFTLNEDLTTTFTVGDAGSYTVTPPYELPDATSLSVSGALPSGVTFVDNGDGTGTLSGTPAATTGGVYTLTVTAKNGSTSAVETLVLTVDEAPTIVSADQTTFTVGQAGSFLVTDGVGYPDPAFTESGALPAGVTFVDNGNGTATLAGTPTAGAGGVYDFTITAANSTLPNATQNFTLTVDEAPTITSAAATTFTVGDAGSFTVTTAHDYPAGTTLSLSGDLPSGVTFVDNGNGSAALAGTPAAGAGGVYTLTITAANGVSPAASQTFTLTVDEAPSISSVNDATFTVGQAGSFEVTTSVGYPDPAFTETGALPAGVTFVDNGNGTATLAGAAAAGDGGVYTLNITAANGTLPNATQTFTLTVDEAPKITSAAAATFTVGAASTFAVTTAHDYPAGTTLSETGSLPAGVTFVDNGNGTATLAGAATAGSGGVYSLSIKATNGISPDASQNFTLTIDEAPKIFTAASATFTVGSAGTFTVTTLHDFPVATTLSETGSLPSGVTFVDNGNGTATLAGTPAVGAGGAYSLTIIAANGVSPNATQNFTLTVDEAPTITSATTTTFAAGATSSFTVTTAHDYPAGTTLSETGDLPSGITFTDNGNGTATFAGVPATAAVGSYPVTITASNGISPDATQSFTLNVVDEADLLVTMNQSSGSSIAGGSITYTVVVANSGPSPAQNVTLSLPLINTLTVLSQSESGTATFTMASQPTLVTDTISTLASGASEAINIVVAVNADIGNGATLVSTATVSSATPDPTSANNSATTSLAVVSYGAMLVTDPFNASLTDLVAATSYASNDSLTVNPASGGGVTVVLDGKNVGTYHPTGRIILYAGLGNDALTVSRSITLETFLYGGNGNDTLSGGGGENVIIGGSGRDVLTGGSGYNIEIGGSGQSRLSYVAGAAADSLLIGGVTSYNHNEAALMALMQEWSSSSVPFATRVASLKAGVDGVALNASTVTLNSVADQLFGSATDLDWFMSVAGVSSSSQGPTGVLNASKGSQIN